jgi:hypothetical protein
MHAEMSSRLGRFTLVGMEGRHEVMFTRLAELAPRHMLLTATPGCGPP